MLSFGETVKVRRPAANAAFTSTARVPSGLSAKTRRGLARSRSFRPPVGRGSLRGFQRFVGFDDATAVVDDDEFGVAALG